MTTVLGLFEGGVMGFPWEGAKCYAEGGMVELKSFLRSKDTRCDQVAIPFFSTVARKLPTVLAGGYYEAIEGRATNRYSSGASNQYWFAS